jgi:hypothetical protein
MPKKPKPRPSPSPEPHASNVVPRLKHVAFDGAVDGVGVPADQRPLSEPFVGDLLIAYAFDLPGMFQMVSEADLAPLDLHRDMLLPLAMDNLHSRLTNIDFKGGPPLLQLVAAEGWEACAMFLDDIWPEVAAKVPGELVIAVPSADTLLVTSSVAEPALARTRELIVEAREKAGRHALSECLFVWRGGRWEVFERAGGAKAGGKKKKLPVK